MQAHSLNTNRLLRTILVERGRWRIGVLTLSLVSAVFAIAAPYAQKRFVDALVEGGAPAPFAFGAFGCTLAALLFAQAANWFANLEALITQKSIADAAFERLLEGPGGLIGNKPAGEAISLFAVDVPGAGALLDQAIVMVGTLVFPIILAPIALHHYFQIPWAASAAALLVLCAINFFLGFRQSKFFYKFKELAAERSGLVAEWIQNVRTLRILGWMEAAEARIFSMRKRETRHRKGMLANGQTMNSIANASTYTLNILAALFLLRYRPGEAVTTPGELLSLFWIMGVFLARPLRQFPWSIVISLDALSSIRRLESAFSQPVLRAEVRTDGPDLPVIPGLALEVRALELEIDGKTRLQPIDLLVAPGELVAIVGEVGSGKSLLLQSLIGATGARFRRFALGGVETSGPVSADVRSRFAFVPQEGFTMSATLSENVVFDYRHRSAESIPAGSVEHSLAVAQFVPERERLDQGVETQIGERGVNLSGGQRQRIGLARAHYSHRPIVLLDDCLSAVDVDTEKRLITSLICGEWANSTRILVTHRLAILPDCDRILFLDEGELLAEGTFTELVAREPRFRDFVRRTETKVAEAAPIHVPPTGGTDHEG